VTAQPTVLHVPSLAAAVTGDLAYNQVHMMTAETVDPNGLSVLVGAISIARAVDDPDLSRHILTSSPSKTRSLASSAQATP
jgi:hypothetical protein